MATKDQKVILKIIVLGCANVGKTSIMTRYCSGKFSEIRRPTVGADFMVKKMKIHDADVTLQIWDTAGAETFQNVLPNLFFQSAHGALLVYDVNNDKSFEQLWQWRDQCISKSGLESGFFPIVVVGNKIDIRDSKPEDQRTSQQVVLNWCRENQYGHIETSVKDNLGVDAAMNAIGGLAFEVLRTNEYRVTSTKKTNSNKGLVDINKSYANEKKSCC
jgi:Ras-related protein Rab-7A